MLDFDSYLQKYYESITLSIRKQYSEEIRSLWHELCSQGKYVVYKDAVDEFMKRRVPCIIEERRALYNQMVEKYGGLTSDQM